MKKYIDTEKLEEEIARLKQPFKKDIEDGVYPTYLCALLDFEELIGSLRQKQPDVDLEKEVVSVCKTYGITEHLDAELGPLDIKNIASHFYELGRNAKNEESEQPEYGYVTTKYVPGKKPRWKVGDILAYYINNSDEEGEDVLGKVINTELDEDGEWLYTFENGDVWYEESLIEEGTYEK